VKLTTQVLLVQRLRSRGVVLSLLHTSVLVLILICLLTIIGLTPGGSSTVHIYTQTIQRTTTLNRIPRMEHI
jgi:sensor histidine kinase YesM